MFLGNPFGKKEWRVCDLEIYEIFVRKEVILCENQFPFATQEKGESADAGALW